MSTATLVRGGIPRMRQQQTRSWLGLYNSDTIWQITLAIVILPLHAVMPNVGLLARAVVQAPITWSARLESLMPLLLTSLTWLSFQRPSDEDAIAGNFTDIATGLEGYAYLFGVSLMIMRYLAFRAGRSQVAGRRVLDRRFLLLALLLVLMLISSMLGLAQGERGWSGPLRAALTAGGFFYGVILAQSYSSNVKLLTGFWVPAGLLFYGLSSLGFLHSRLVWTFAPFVSAAATTVVLKQPFTAGGAVALLTLAVSGWRCVLAPLSTGTLLLLWSGGVISAVFATRQSLGLGRSLRRPAVVLAAAAMIMATLYVTFQKETLYAARVSRQESLSEYLWWKLVADRGNIWSQAMTSFLDRPLSETLFVPGGQWLTLQHHGRYQHVKMGLHNAALHAIYYYGWLPGGLLCLFIFLLCWDCVRALGRRVPADIEVMAFGVLINVIVGGFSGTYFLTMEGGTWFYIPAGIVTGYFYRDCISSAHAYLAPSRRAL